MNREELCGNEDTGLLKLIAMVFMICDHVGKIFFPTVMEWRIVGRIAFPIYLWCMVVGACRTRNPRKYALRLFIGAVISQPFYMLAMNHTWTQGNVYFTLLLGYLSIWGIRENKRGSRLWAPALCLLVSLIYRIDYIWKGVLLAILMYACREKKKTLAAMFVPFCMFWGVGTLDVTKILGYTLPEILRKSTLPAAFLKLQAMAVLALPIILWDRKKYTRLPKAFSYAVYPAHFLILWIIKLLLGMTNMAGSLALFM